MARAKRNELDRLMDQRFLTELYFQYGEQFNATMATELINARRAASARSCAEGLGLQGEDAEEMVRDSQLTPQTVRRDLRDLQDRVRTAAELGGAGLLDSQLARLERRLDAIDEQLAQVDADEQALLGDIERSRTGSWQRVSGELHSKDGQVTSQSPQKMLSHTNDGAADPRLWDKYLKCHDKREKLLERESRLMRDQRLLVLGRQWFAGQGEGGSFAQALTEATTPDAARTLVMQRLAEEVDRLPYGGDVMGSMPIEIARAHQAAVRAQVGRMNAIKGVLAASTHGVKPTSARADNNGGVHVIELAVRRPGGET